LTILCFIIKLWNLQFLSVFSLWQLEYVTRLRAHLGLRLFNIFEYTACVKIYLSLYSLNRAKRVRNSWNQFRINKLKWAQTNCYVFENSVHTCRRLTKDLCQKICASKIYKHKNGYWFFLKLEFIPVWTIPYQLKLGKAVESSLNHFTLV
jgi:hypothetical protein